MRIISYNTNGIRAAIKKGLLEWLQTDPADIICIQETKANKEDVDVKSIEALGFETYWFSAQKKGYSGVAVFTKIKPDNVEYGHKKEQSDFEGRVIRLDFGKLTLINAYFPSVRLQNKGWRIDYISVTNNLKDKLQDAKIYPDVKQSDHCPIYAELKL